jgi:hypothetical protein
MSAVPRQCALVGICCTLLSLSVRALWAQSRFGGVVASTMGRPIPGASVEAWQHGVRLGVAESDEIGRFHLTLPEGTDSLVLAVRAIGFRPASLLAPIGAPAQVLLAPVPVSLPEISASTKSRCPARNDLGALDAWLRAATEGAEDRASLEARYQAYEDVVTAPDFGIPHTAPAEEGRFGMTDLSRHHWQQTIRTKGYGWPSLEVGSAEWVNPPLEGSMVEVFFAREFAEDHTFSWKSGEPGVVLFCSRNRSRPYIDGVVTLDPDGVLQSIEWVFRGGRRQGLAGGGAAFLASSPGPGERRLPSVGIAWRQLPDGRFFQRTFQYSKWLSESR